MLALPTPADAESALERTISVCIDQILRETPRWGAMRKFRDQMGTTGFTAQNAGAERGPKRGRSWTVYHVRLRGEGTSYRIACEQR